MATMYMVAGRKRNTQRNLLHPATDTSGQKAKRSPRSAVRSGKRSCLNATSVISPIALQVPTG